MGLYFHLLTYGYDSEVIMKFLKDVFSLIQEGGCFTADIINQELEHRNQALVKVNDFMLQRILKIGEAHFGWKVNSQSIN